MEQRQTTGRAGLWVRWKWWVPAMCTALLLASAPMNAQPPGSTHLSKSNGDGRTVTAIASLQYRHPSLLKRVALGKNYRSQWERPVTLPVFNLKGFGFTIQELGGGMQTKSLRMTDRQGIGWVLRTIDKDVKKALPPGIRNPLTVKVAQDMVSGAHPYAPPVVASLARSAGITAADPQIFFVPDDPAFGEHRKLFANQVCLLELRDVAPGKITSKSTEELVEALLKNNRSETYAPTYLRARLLDMLIADWDRHYDQWRWLEADSGRLQVYHALPKDRDQAFFYSNGLLVKIVRLFTLKHLVGFTYKTSNLRRLSAKSWNLDRLLLNELEASDWERITRQALHSLSDQNIAEAVRQFPREILATDSALIASKLISRRNQMFRDVMRYYRFLSKTVTVTGSDEPELFELWTNGDRVRVVKYADPSRNRIAFDRTVDRDETGEVVLLGLGGNDQFIVHGKLPSRFRLRIDGGSGQNTYETGKKSRRLRFADSDMDAGSRMKYLKKSLPIKD